MPNIPGSNKGKAPRRSAGFTLLELAVVLLIVGIVSVGIVQIARAYLQQTAINATQQRLQAIQSALILYASRNGYIPCPAGQYSPSGVGTGTAQYASTTNYDTCSSGGSSAGQNSVMGAVPWATLGIAQQTAVDGWGHPIGYFVYDGYSGIDSLTPSTTLGSTSVTRYASTTLSNPKQNGLDFTACSCPGPDCTSASLDTSATAYLACSTSTTDFVNAALDGIGLPVGLDTANLVANPSNYTGAAFVLISYGKNGFQYPQSTYEVQNKLNLSNPPSSSATAISLVNGVPFFYDRLQNSQSCSSLTACNYFGQYIDYMQIIDLAWKAGWYLK